MKKIVFLLLLATFFGCSSRNEIKISSTDKREDRLFYTINFPDMLKKQQKVPVSEFAESIEYIALETTPQSILGRTLDACFSKDYIFIEHAGGPLAKFDKTGKFVGYIGITGNGPEEYNGLRTFSIDEENSLIFIQANWARKMMVFSFDGSFLRSFEVGDEKQIVWSRDSFFMSFSEPLVGNEEYVFKETEENGTIVQSVRNYCKWPIPPPYGRSVAYSDRHAFYRLNNKLHFKGEYNDTVYALNGENKIEPVLFIDLGKFLLPPEMRIERGLTNDLPDDYYWVSVKETSRYLFIHYATYGIAGNEDELWYADAGYIYYDKQTKEWKNIDIKDDKSGFVNDIDGGPHFIPEYTNDSTAFCIISSVEFQDYINSETFRESMPDNPEKKIKLIEQMQNIAENNNDIIMVLHLKD